MTKTVVLDTGEEEEKTFPVMRTFCVFKIEWANGLDYWVGISYSAPAGM